MEVKTFFHKVRHDFNSKNVFLMIYDVFTHYHDLSQFIIFFGEDLGRAF